jgi:hypothetical protein
MATTLQNRNSRSPMNVSAKGQRTWTKRTSECFWFLLSLVLFVVLGPFSGPVALIVLCRLGLEESVHTEPESIFMRN